MILTKEIFNSGRSSNNGFNSKQIKCLGVTYPLRGGWMSEIIGKDFPEEAIRLFLDMKDAHFSKEKIDKFKLKKSVIISFEPCDEKTKYQDQYKHPNWQKMRLFVLKRDDFKCINCGDRPKMLHVHHLKYSKSFIWSVPHWYLVTL